MALDYIVYYRKPKEELSDLLNQFAKREDINSLFSHYSTKNIDPIDNEILNEMGYEGKYLSYIFFRLDKSNVVEATNALKLFRDNHLGKENSVFLLNGDTELLP